MTPCRLIYPYFDNPQMLDLQIENWNRFEGELRDAIRLIIIDDHSKVCPQAALEQCKAPVNLYRVNQRIPWNMHQCRNIGAKVAGKDDMWLFFSDIDIVLTPEMAYTMLSKELDPGKHYTFDRTFPPEFSYHKPHVNSFLVRRAAFWQINGYDLDLTPVGGGGYGGDNQFRRQLNVICPEEVMNDVVLIGYGRRSRQGMPVVKDADTQGLNRDEWHEKYRQALARKKASGDMRSIDPIRTGYTRIL